MELTAAQKLFIIMCKKQGLTQEQTAIYMTIFSKEEIRDILQWVSDLMNSKGKPELKTTELLEELYDRALAKIKAERLRSSVQPTERSTDSQ